MSLKWRVARVRAMSSREIAFRVGRAVRARAERWGLGLAKAPAPSGPAGNAWLSSLPKHFDTVKYKAAADRILSGSFHVFAMENAALGFPPKWNTDPPTSGPHYEVPAVYGEYDTPLKPAQFVHNLEHGAVFVLYGPKVPAATVQQLSDFYNEDTTGMLLAPYPKLGDKIALGAWTVPDDFEPGGTNGTAYLATCTKFDEDAFSTFRDELRFRGPERFPPDSLQPGST